MLNSFSISVTAILIGLYSLRRGSMRTSANPYNCSFRTTVPMHQREWRVGHRLSRWRTRRPLETNPPPRYTTNQRHTPGSAGESEIRTMSSGQVRGELDSSHRTGLLIQPTLTSKRFSAGFRSRSVARRSMIPIRPSTPTPSTSSWLHGFT